MSTTTAPYTDGIPVIDVHEHHMPDTFLKPEVGLLQILQESYAGWTRAPSGVTAAAPGRGTWEEIAAYVEGSGTNAFVRNVVQALGELYGLGDRGITRDTWEDLDARIRKNHADPRPWTASVLDRAGIERVVADPYRDPLLDVRAALGDRHVSVLRINSFAFGWHRESRDHNGNSARELLSRLGLEARSFEDYLAALPLVLDHMPGRNMVGLKNALAYDRGVNFNDLDTELARSAWDKRDPSPAQKKAFGDVVVDRLCRLAGERDLPFQMHLGSALIRGSRPLEAAGLIERNPGTRFLLMHLAWPWSDELLGMAFTYRNIWIDLTWSWLLSPARFIGSFEQAVDVLPDESRMMIGGDAWHAEETWGAIRQARMLIGSALDQGVRAGRFGRADAERLARKILRDNAASFFRLPGENRQG
ncbi:MAG TPA: amidohydrolase family protein [Spirochaetia bacterium]|nr:amidohydrolase family protein [Spirochaetia bacterium]